MGRKVERGSEPWRETEEGGETDLGWEAESHGDKVVPPNTGGVEGGRPSRIKAGPADGVGYQTEDEQEEEDEGGGDDEGVGDALDLEDRRDDGGQGTHTGDAEHPQERDHGIAHSCLYRAHWPRPFFPSLPLSPSPSLSLTPPPPFQRFGGREDRMV